MQHLTAAIEDSHDGILRVEPHRPALGGRVTVTLGVERVGAVFQHESGVVQEGGAGGVRR